MLFMLPTDEGFIEVEPDSAYDIQDEPSLEAKNSKQVEEEEPEILMLREGQDDYGAFDDASNAFKGASQVRVWTGELVNMWNFIVLMKTIGLPLVMMDIVAFDSFHMFSVYVCHLLLAQGQEMKIWGTNGVHEQNVQGH